MDYENTNYEMDLYGPFAVFTNKVTGLCGTLSLKKANQVSTKQMIEYDIKKHGAQKALNTYAKLVTNWTQYKSHIVTKETRQVHPSEFSFYAISEAYIGSDSGVVLYPKYQWFNI